MLPSISFLQLTPNAAPTLLFRRTSRPVRIHELSVEYHIFLNTVRWFCQNRLCSALLLSRIKLDSALNSTPAFHKELTVRNSCARPARFDGKHAGIFGRVHSKNEAENFARTGVISRGLRTETKGSRHSHNDGDPSAKHKIPGQAHFSATWRESNDDRYLRLLKDLDGSDPKERARLLSAFAEGYKFSLPPKLVAWIYVSIVLLTLIFILKRIKQIKTINAGIKEISPEDIDVTFEDVIGVEEAKQGLQEIVEYLKDPNKFSRLGGKLPKGALLVGPPGTGKTLLARAVAGEAEVPFFYVPGSEFDDKFAGQGALRIRSLFKAAKIRAPCVIFIDEIDSVGRKRSNSTLNPYANQTINQLLSEMDGFIQNEGIIVLGATNRRDDLDKALLRSGRFDIEIQVPPPDVTGREKLFAYYVSRIKCDEDVDTGYLARGTFGFTGAHIENMVNQAALRAAIDGQSSVTQAYLENARDKVLMGPEQRSRIPDHEDNVITAYHEGGHALVSHFTKDSMPIHKVTIIARGQSLGHTAHIPSKDELYVRKSRILARMDTLMGGRAAEELTFGKERITTGAGSDFQQATDLATNMVKHWGMSEKVGQRFIDTDHDSLAVVNELSESMTELIDEEIERALHESMERAKHILRTHERELKLLAEALLKYETLSATDVKQLLETGTLNR